MWELAILGALAVLLVGIFMVTKWAASKDMILGAGGVILMLSLTLLIMNVAMSLIPSNAAYNVIGDVVLIAYLTGGRIFYFLIGISVLLTVVIIWRMLKLVLVQSQRV